MRGRLSRRARRSTRCELQADESLSRFRRSFTDFGLRAQTPWIRPLASLPCLRHSLEHSGSLLLVASRCSAPSTSTLTWRSLCSHMPSLWWGSLYWGVSECLILTQGRNAEERCWRSQELERDRRETSNSPPLSAPEIAVGRRIGFRCDKNGYLKNMDKIGKSLIAILKTRGAIRPFKFS